MRLSQDDTSWKCRGIKHRDFRHTHGDPEIPKHRKKRKKIDRSKCSHEFVKTSRHGKWYETWMCKHCGKKDWRWY